MAETNSAGIDMTALAGLIATSVATAVAEANKPILDQIGKLQSPAPAPAAAAASKDGTPKPITMEDIKALLDGRDKSAAKSATRDGYAKDKLGDLPAAYRNQLPDTDDMGALDKAAQTIREGYREDLKAKGFTVADVGGNAPANGVPPAKGPVDMSKMSPTQLIEMGLKQAGPPARIGTPAPEAAK